MSVETDLQNRYQKAISDVNKHPRAGERREMLKDIIMTAMQMLKITNATIADGENNATPR